MTDRLPDTGPSTSPSAYSPDFLLELYRTIYTIRLFEHRGIELYRAGLIRGYFHTYLGEEAVAAGVCAALDRRDYIVSTHRGHGHCIARGADIRRMVAEILGKETGYCKGLGGSMHIADTAGGNLGANGIVGGGIAMGVGAALGASIRGEDRVCAIFFSDGASNNGVFAESLNLAAVWNAPAVFVLENNHYAVCTPIEKSCRADHLYRIGEGFGVQSSMIDGNDVLEVFEATQEAVGLCRTMQGPVLIEAKTFRYGGHHVNDPGNYVPRERLEYFKAKDPLKVARGHALAVGGIDHERIAGVEREVEHAMDEAVAFAKDSRELSPERFFQMMEDY